MTPGIYYANRSAQPLAVTLKIVAHGKLRIEGADFLRFEHVHILAMRPALNKLPSVILFTDGARCEIESQTAFSTLFNRKVRMAAWLRRHHPQIQRWLVALLVGLLLWFVVRQYLPQEHLAWNFRTSHVAH